MKKIWLGAMCLWLCGVGCKRPPAGEEPAGAIQGGARVLKPAEQRPVALFPVRVEGKYGYIDRSGKMVIEPQFLVGLSFSEGLAAVRAPSGLWGYIDRTGKYVIEATFNRATAFHEGTASVVFRDLFGAINLKGEWVVKPQFTGLGYFCDGLAPAHVTRMEQGLELRHWGYINQKGQFVLRPQYEEAINFGEGLAGVRILGEYWGYIDRTGKKVTAGKFGAVSPFSEGLAAVQTLGGAWGYINKSGGYVIPPKFGMAVPFSEGLAAVVLDGKWCYIDKNGKVMIPGPFSDTGQFSQGLARVRTRTRIPGKKNAKGGPEFKETEGYIDTSGKYIWSSERK